MLYIQWTSVLQKFADAARESQVLFLVGHSGIPKALWLFVSFLATPEDEPAILASPTPGPMKLTYTTSVPLLGT